jgi:hypothetical protein
VQGWTTSGVPALQHVEDGLSTVAGGRAKSILGLLPNIAKRALHEQRQSRARVTNVCSPPRCSTLS